MAHNVKIGAYTAIKQSKSGLCRSEVVTNTSIGELVLKITCPLEKIWLIQQLSAFNGAEPAARVCYFNIVDEGNNFVSFLSNNGVAKSSIAVGDAKTYDGFGLSFVPEGWSITVRWFGITVIGSVTLYAHLTEIDLV